jgi:hypothetical protein
MYGVMCTESCGRVHTQIIACAIDRCTCLLSERMCCHLWHRKEDSSIVSTGSPFKKGIPCQQISYVCIQLYKYKCIYTSLTNSASFNTVLHTYQSTASCFPAATAWPAKTHHTRVQTPPGGMQPHENHINLPTASYFAAATAWPARAHPRRTPQAQPPLWCQAAKHTQAQHDRI